MKNDKVTKLTFKELVLYNKYLRAFQVLKTILSYTVKSQEKGDRLAVLLKTHTIFTAADLNEALSEYKLQNIYRPSSYKGHIPDHIIDVVRARAEGLMSWIGIVKGAPEDFDRQVRNIQHHWSNKTEDQISDAINREVDTMEDVIAMKRFEMKYHLDQHHRVKDLDQSDLFTFYHGDNLYMSIANASAFESLQKDLKDKFNKTFAIKDDQLRLYETAREEGLTTSKMGDLVDQAITMSDNVEWLWDRTQAMLASITKGEMLEYVAECFYDGFMEYDEIRISGTQIKSWQEQLEYDLLTPSYGPAYLRIHPQHNDKVEISEGTVIAKDECKRMIEAYMQKPRPVAFKSEVIGDVSFDGPGDEGKLSFGAVTLSWRHVKKFYTMYLK